MSNQNSFKNTIKSYLDERARTDELFAKSYEKPNKSLDECCNYILGEVLKSSTSISPRVKFTDMKEDIMYGMAVHYYDEDDIKIEKLSANVRVSASTPSTSPTKPPKPVELTEDEMKTARKEAIKRLAEEQYASLKKKPAKTKKEANEVQQMSLF